MGKNPIQGGVPGPMEKKTRKEMEDAERQSRTLTIERTHPDAVMPKYQNPGDAGFDLAIVESVVMSPGQTAIVNTGLRFNIPEGYEVQLRPRSGKSSKGLTAKFGTIDSGYRGEVGIILHNDSPAYMSISAGDRLAQGVFTPVIQAVIEEGVVSTDTVRGEGGFGSTGG